MPLLIYPNSLTTYGAEASVFGATQNNTTTASSAQTITPPGFYFVITGAHTTVQFTPDNGGTYNNIVAVSSTGMIFSDGQSVQLKNDATGGSTARYWQILGNV